MNVTVKRSQWFRGHGWDTAISRLLITDKTSDKAVNYVAYPKAADIGKMCCLGFTALAFGYSKEDIANVETPLGLVNSIERMPGLIDPNDCRHSHTCMDMMAANDSDRIDDARREYKLIRLGKQVGINFTFVD